MAKIEGEADAEELATCYCPLDFLPLLFLRGDAPGLPILEARAGLPASCMLGLESDPRLDVGAPDAEMLLLLLVIELLLDVAAPRSRGAVVDEAAAAARLAVSVAGDDG
jgi:hypothetical protein